MKDKDTMILMDTETTGLPGMSVIPIDRQPRIFEFSGLKIDARTLAIRETLTFICDPGVPIPPEVTKITGVKTEDVAGKPKFARRYPELVNFFLGARYLVAHNLPFDRQMLAFELTRMDKLCQFPWPSDHICTVEHTGDIRGHYISLTDLYIHYYGTDPSQKHRGEGDVRILYDIVVKMREEGRL